MDARRDRDVPVPCRGWPCHGCGTRAQRGGRHAAYAAGQAAAVAHVAAHGSALPAYAIKAVRAAAARW